MASFVPISEVEGHLIDLLNRVESGEEIFILREGHPSAMLTSVPAMDTQDLEPAPRGPRKFGDNFLGITYIAPDFYDDLPPEMFEALNPHAK